MKKLYIQLTGGLGNQLYIVATGLSLANSLGTKLVVDKSIYNHYKLRNEIVSKFLKDLVIKDMSFKIRNINIFNLKKKFFHKIKESKLGYDDLIIRKVKKKNNFFEYYLIGYFQSVKYFRNILGTLKEEIQTNIQKEYPEVQSNKVKQILENSIAIHIRRQDKITGINKKIYGSVNKIEIFKIVEKLYKKNDYKYLLLLGDDSKFIEELKKYLSQKFNTLSASSICTNTSIAHDFYYLMNCKGLILSNSSFGIWAGYLSNSKNIYYPNPLFPKPLHHSIKSLSKSDIILKKWKPYKVFYEV